MVLLLEVGVLFYCCYFSSSCFVCLVVNVNIVWWLVLLLLLIMIMLLFLMLVLGILLLFGFILLFLSSTLLFCLLHLPINYIIVAFVVVAAIAVMFLNAMLGMYSTVCFVLFCVNLEKHLHSCKFRVVLPYGLVLWFAFVVLGWFCLFALQYMFLLLFWGGLVDLFCLSQSFFAFFSC